ncbi:nuclear transport factor 2 family protein [Phreatobacter aquaticus]|uniref:Nuclear transport factor 2 family protein n=1 Tax=Phreatobacter aquaticus TaxID=2570229 RepID=A0A4D7QGF2_9HYPH|nr:nuclear transport factor 2 family protein [Phreatobacter aquaticus]QCK86015.1 nuclear transport factor 2 family protein [Phreatobacter aquaticus]
MTETASGQTPRQLAEAFYEAFAARDAKAMGALYADDAQFEDPVFGKLDAAKVRFMWRLLLGRATDLAVSYEVMEATDTTARVAWTAGYTFGQTGRPVVNRVVGTLTFRDGLIVDHVDRFSFWAWARQALGLPGLLLGWTPFLQGQVSAKARKTIGL